MVTRMSISVADWVFREVEKRSTNTNRSEYVEETLIKSWMQEKPESESHKSTEEAPLHNSPIVLRWDTFLPKFIPNLENHTISLEKMAPMFQ